MRVIRFSGVTNILNLPAYSFRQYPVRTANHSDELDGEKLRDFRQSMLN
jgi:hypothetical protein